MTEPASLRPIWERLDEHRRDIGALQVAQGETRGQVKLLDQRITSFRDDLRDLRRESKEGHSHIEAAMTRLTDSVQELAIEAAQNKGGKMERREIIAWAFAAMGTTTGLIAAVANFL